MNVKQTLISIGERAGASFLQVLVSVLLAGGALSAVQTGGHVPWVSALDQGAFAAAVAVLSGFVALKLALHNRYEDLAWRVLLTFGGSLLATFSAANTAHSVVHFRWSTACYVALIAAVMALGKALIGFWAPTAGASVLVPAPPAVAAPAAPPAAVPAVPAQSPPPAAS